MLRHVKPTLTFICRRSVASMPVLAVIGLLTFTLVRLAPGDPARSMLGKSPSEKQIDQLRDSWGLNQPFLFQLWSWLKNILQGDFGNSIQYGTPVTKSVVAHIGPTLSISAIALIIIVGVGIPLGLLAGYHKDSVGDKSVMFLTFVGMSVPEFWIGIMLALVFSVGLGLLPVSGYVGPDISINLWLSAIILPAVALAVDQIALVSRMVRDSVATTSTEPWVTALRARGLSTWIVLMKHQLKSATVAAMTVVGNAFAGIVTGAVVIENVFNIHGIGWLTVQAAKQRDYPLLQGSVLLAAVAFVFINLIVDAFYAIVDPRIRAMGA